MEPNDRKEILQPFFENFLTCLSTEFVKDYSLQFKYLLNILRSFNIEHFMEIDEAVTFCVNIFKAEIILISGILFSIAVYFWKHSKMKY